MPFTAEPDPLFDSDSAVGLTCSVRDCVVLYANCCPPTNGQVDRRVLALIEAFRKNQIPVGRTTITSFARAIKASLLASPGTAEEKKKLEKFGASDKWVKNFVSRSGLVSRPLPLKDGVDSERLQENLKEVQEDFKQYDLTDILGFDESGLLPRRSYLSSSEARSIEPAENNGGESLGSSGT